MFTKTQRKQLRKLIKKNLAIILTLSIFALLILSITFDKIANFNYKAAKPRATISPVTLLVNNINDITFHNFDNNKIQQINTYNLCIHQHNSSKAYSIKVENTFNDASKLPFQLFWVNHKKGVKKFTQDNEMLPSKRYSFPFISNKKCRGNTNATLIIKLKNQALRKLKEDKNSPITVINFLLSAE